VNSTVPSCIVVLGRIAMIKVARCSVGTSDSPRGPKGMYIRVPETQLNVACYNQD
jgi:hypothetical protein